MADERWRDADPKAVIEAMAPEIERPRGRASPRSSRRPPRASADASTCWRRCRTPSAFPRRPDGIYQEPRTPERARDATEEKLLEWFLAELTEGIGGTDVPAGWIEISTDDADPDGLSADEGTILRAAARAGVETGAAIGSHTIQGDLVHRQFDVVEFVGYRPDRFVWIRTRAEADRRMHDEVADRGAYVEYDRTGGADQHDDTDVELVSRMLERGHRDCILSSQDRGWYDPSEPSGGDVDPYTPPETFLPRLRASDVDETVRRLTRGNPFEAFGR